MLPDPSLAPGPLPPGQPRGVLVDEVRRALAPLPEGAQAVVAVSGGPDSTALAFLVAEARSDLGLTLGHVRHGLRDDAADVAAVRRHASYLGLRLEIVDVMVTSAGEGPEAAARSHRYAALRSIAREVDAGWLLVGHTADDQAETLLLRLVRGTGLHGLGGMAPIRGDVVRPMLRLRRNDVRRFVTGEGLDVVEDPTNRDRRFRRNAARHDVLPALEALGPDPVGALARIADLARDDARRLDADAAEIADTLVHRHGPVAAVRVDALGTLDPALARRVVRRLVMEVRGSEDPPSAAQVAAVLALEAGGAVDLPGATASCGGGWLALGPADVGTAEPVALTVPGVTRWPATGISIVASIPGRTADAGTHQQLSLDLQGAWAPPRVMVDERTLPPGGDVELGQIVLPATIQPAQLVARPREPGDRISLSGGTRKLQDVLVDAGVPRLLRDLLPVVASPDRVVWLPGLAVDTELDRSGRREPVLHLAVAR